MILNTMSLHRKWITKAAIIGVRNIRTSSALRRNLYEALGLTRDATQADIKKAYFELSKIYHPDRIAATDENLARFREITDAYEVLGNEQSRKLYDRGLMGDFRRPGEDDSAEITDPIIKFYKKRHEMTRPKTSDELEAWTQTYYKQAKEKASLKSQFYTASKRQKVERYNTLDDFYALFVIVVSTLLFLTNFENTVPEKLWRKVFNSD